MKRSFRGVSTFLGGAVLIALACFTAPNCQPSGGDLSGTGGSDDSGTGGSSSGTGGKSTSDGTGGSSNGSGGKSTSDGSGGSSTGSGGKSGGTGGKSGGSGGNAGGSSSSGTGGSSASGTGGSSTASGTGGSAASGAGGTTSSGTTGSGTTVTISNGKGVGAMVGYGWVSLGSADTITDPVCGTAQITSATSCSATTWSTTDSLCVTGSIPALPASPASTDYSSNWGLAVGLNATEPAGSGIGQSFTSIAVAISGGPAASNLRVELHRKGDPDGTSYCYPYATGALTLTKFATDCYNTTPTKTLAAADIPSIDKVSVQVFSGTTAITVTKLCITGITFAK